MKNSPQAAGNTTRRDLKGGHSSPLNPEFFLPLDGGGLPASGGLTLPRQRGREYYLPTQFRKEPVFPSPIPRIKYGGIQSGFLDTGACPGPDPGFAGMTNSPAAAGNTTRRDLKGGHSSPLHLEFFLPLSKIPPVYGGDGGGLRWGWYLSYSHSTSPLRP